MRDDSLNSSLPVTNGSDINNSEKDEKKEHFEQVKQIIKIFHEYSPSVVYENKTQIKAVEDMLRIYGIEQLINMANTAISVQDEKYAPSITTPYELFNKVKKLEKFLITK